MGATVSLPELSGSTNRVLEDTRVHGLRLELRDACRRRPGQTSNRGCSMSEVNCDHTLILAYAYAFMLITQFQT